jgi:glycosyltransferase involved in cell wall biosynthesis
MAEAVTHNVNGLLFENGNVEDLADKLKLFIENPELLGKLSSNIPSVKNVKEEVLELEEIYYELINNSISGAGEIRINA